MKKSTALILLAVITIIGIAYFMSFVLYDVHQNKETSIIKQVDNNYKDYLIVLADVLTNEGSQEKLDTFITESNNYFNNIYNIAMDNQTNVDVVEKAYDLLLKIFKGSSEVILTYFAATNGS